MCFEDEPAVLRTGDRIGRAFDEPNAFLLEQPALCTRIHSRYGGADVMNADEASITPLEHVAAKVRSDVCSVEPTEGLDTRISGRCSER